jgi:oxygen-independent coproporphyrinogen-3 oxidase
MSSSGSEQEVVALPPDAPELADAAHEWKSAYIHVPFCRRRCPYCDFAIVDETATTVSHDRYVDAVIAEMAMENDFAQLHAINIGGGTPSTLSADQLLRIVAAAIDRFGLVDGAEISLEINPEDWSPGFGHALVAGGFTRVSIGAQSMDDTILGVLGRSHVASRIVDVVTGAAEAGFRSVSADLIFGHPAEAPESWRRSVEALLDLPVDHVSTYALTVEPGTDLAKQIRGGASQPDGDVQADRYELFSEIASSRGIRRYEVSNHAADGHACRYNLSTWSHAEYVGFGMGAHDHRWGVRSRNHRRIDRYLADVEAGRRPRLGTEQLGPREQERDRLMLGLRLAAGTPITPTAQRFIDSDAGESMLDHGLLRVVDNRLMVVNPFLADAVAREALSVPVDDC